MIILDILAYNLTNSMLFTAPLMVHDLNDNRLYLTLIIDIIFNGVPFCTITILLLYFFNKRIIRYVSNGVFYKFVMSIIFLIIYVVVVYSIFNKFSLEVFKLINSNLYLSIIFNAGVIFLRRGHKLN